MPSNDPPPRSARRVALLVLTVFTLCQVIVGSTLLAPVLEVSVSWFTVFWLSCFASILAIFILAFLEIRLVRRDHRLKKKELEQELSRILGETEKKPFGDRSKR